MRLRLVLLLVTRLATLLRLSRRAGSWKDGEILLLRHQLTILRRQPGIRPKFSGADRALIATLLSMIPRARRAGLPMIVTPGTALRWHRDIVRRRWAPRSRRKRPGRPAAHHPRPFVHGQAKQRE
jgi:putative transposase